MSKTILIVEDDILNMKLMNDLLAAQGYRIVQSRNGSDVIELAREHSPDLVIMDIQLPGRSGLEVTKALKADKGLTHIPIIAVTAFALRGDEERIRAAGCDDYIAKPISVADFLQQVSGHLT